MSIASRIESMESNISNAYKSLDDLGIDLTNTNKNIENISTKIDDVYNMLSKVSGTGTDITLNNTAKGRLLKNDLSGRTEQGILPNEYQQVEYIESTGTQYIDTGYKVNMNTDTVEVEVDVTRENGSHFVFGNYSTNNYYGFNFYGEASSLYFYYNVAQVIINTSHSGVGEITKLKATNTNFYVNNTSVGTFETVNNTTPYNAFIFGASSSSSTADFLTKMKLYSCKITSANNVVRNFIPCYRKSDNVIGLFDIVNNVFYTNAGTGTFNKGNNIPKPQYPQQIKNVTGDANEKIQNKNLFVAQKIVEDSNNASVYLTQDGFIRYVTSSNRMIIKPTIIKENTAYTFKFMLKSGVTAENNIGFTAIYKDGTSESLSSNIRTNIDEFEQIFTTNSNKTLDYIRSNYTSSKEAFLKIEGSMILEGTYTTETIPSYVSHEEQHLPFTFSEGQRAMQGTTLEDDGIHNTRKQVVLDGTEDWDVAGTQYENLFSAFIYKTDMKRQYIFTGDLICSHFIEHEFSYQGESITKSSNPLAFDIMMLRISTEKANSLEELKTWLATQYNNGTPVIVEYELATPETIPYNSTQQAQYEAIKNARSYDDITYITSTSDELGFDMSVEALEQSVKQVLGGNY